MSTSYSYHCDNNYPAIMENNQYYYSSYQQQEKYNQTQYYNQNYYYSQQQLRYQVSPDNAEECNQAIYPTSVAYQAPLFQFNHMSVAEVGDQCNDGSNVLQDDNFSIVTASDLCYNNTSPSMLSTTLLTPLSTPSPQISNLADTSANNYESLFNNQYTTSELFEPVHEIQPDNYKKISHSNFTKATTTGLAAVSTEKRHICPVCSHRSKRRHNLVEHMLTHNPHRPKSFLCGHCNRPFARKYDMKRHEKIHSRK
ncbi:unnamed protein product [Mucor hiemalis]